MGGRGLVREGGQSALIGFWEIRATLVVNERRCCDPVLLRLADHQQNLNSNTQRAAPDHIKSSLFPK